MEKKSWIRGTGIVVEDLVTILNNMIWIGLLKTVTFEQRNKKRERSKGLQGKGTASAKSLSTEWVQHGLGSCSCQPEMEIQEKCSQSLLTWSLGPLRSSRLKFRGSVNLDGKKFHPIFFIITSNWNLMFFIRSQTQIIELMTLSAVEVTDIITSHDGCCIPFKIWLFSSPRRIKVPLVIRPATGSYYLMY